MGRHGKQQSFRDSGDGGEGGGEDRAMSFGEDKRGELISSKVIGALRTSKWILFLAITASLWFV